ncbi:hypothetical protein BgiBS90_008685 [Biomphalaria glabrata]|nr:hypothetical protein BgiBS90_008685 [Biomphalaria glabrata]
MNENSSRLHPDILVCALRTQEEMLEPTLRYVNRRNSFESQLLSRRLTRKTPSQTLSRQSFGFSYRGEKWHYLEPQKKFYERVCSCGVKSGNS